MLPKKILIVDDEKMIRLTTGILLKKRGISVIEAKSGAEGLELVKTEKPDLILLDIMMPLMDGWEFLDIIRSDQATQNISIIIFTASDYIEAERMAKIKNVQGIIRKPISIKKMLDSLDSSMKGMNDG